MFIIIGALLLFGVPAAIFCSFWAGIRVLGHNKLLAGVILTGAVTSTLTFLWQMRFDIALISNLLGWEILEMSQEFDTDMIFMAVYVLLFLAVLVARVRWRPQYGSALALNLALIFWLLAGVPFFMLEFLLTDAGVFGG